MFAIPLNSDGGNAFDNFSREENILWVFGFQLNSHERELGFGHLKRDVHVLPFFMKHEEFHRVGVGRVQELTRHLQSLWNNTVKDYIKIYNREILNLSGLANRNLLQVERTLGQNVDVMATYTGTRSNLFPGLCFYPEIKRRTVVNMVSHHAFNHSAFSVPLKLSTQSFRHQHGSPGLSCFSSHSESKPELSLFLNTSRSKMSLYTGTDSSSFFWIEKSASVCLMQCLLPGDIWPCLLNVLFRHIQNRNRYKNSIFLFSFKA